jgi:predicted MFS family arabinose efflux permease
MMAQGLQGNFSYYVAGAGQNEMGLLARALNAVSRRLQELYARLLAEVAQLGGATARRGEDLLVRLRDRFTVAENREAQQIRAGNLIFVRTPLFLFVFAEELSRSFFPIYVRDLYDPSTGLSPDLAIGLPISIFMLIAAIATPVAGLWSDRIGRRPIFLMGAIPAALGLALTGFAQGLWDLLAFRCLSAAGYGMVFIACQGYVLDNTSGENRAKGIAIYVGAIMAADICGPAIGGIMADRVGFRATFFLAAVLTLISSVMVYQILSDDTGVRERRRALSAGDFKLLLSNPRFLVLLGLAAMPAKLLLTGFLFYLAPLYLLSLGNTQSSIGRIMMAYGVATLLITPVAANLADKLNRGTAFVAGGGFLAGLGLLALLLDDGSWPMVAAIALLGVGQAISISPQLALVPQICRREIEQVGITTTVAVYRIVERLGGVLGPFVVGALVASSGYIHAVMYTGLGMIACACGFLLFFAVRPIGRSRETD